jgi:hypothetical protein
LIKNTINIIIIILAIKVSAIEPLIDYNTIKKGTIKTKLNAILV